MSVFLHPAFDTHEAVHFFQDSGTGLKGIIALHSTALGPAAGGCRMWPYASEAEALTDVLRLSRGMSYKNAMAGLPLGGGKAVIMADSRSAKSEPLLQAFGRVVQGLSGRYITAEDVGMSEQDMTVIRRTTRYVSGLPQEANETSAGGDPSPKTALGVFHGIRSAVRAATGSEDLSGLRVAIQGLGNVGFHLGHLLHEAGARLVVSDIDPARCAKAKEAFGAEVVAADEILFAAVDIVAPCALGGILNGDSIPRLRCRIVAGAANNQLLTDADGLRLAQRNILYAPDYVINAGGIISVAAEYLGNMDQNAVLVRVRNIGRTLDGIFAAARTSGRPTSEVADVMARSRIAAAVKSRGVASAA